MGVALGKYLVGEGFVSLLAGKQRGGPCAQQPCLTAVPASNSHRAGLRPRPSAIRSVAHRRQPTTANAAQATDRLPDNTLHPQPHRGFPTTTVSRSSGRTGVKQAKIGRRTDLVSPRRGRHCIQRMAARRRFLLGCRWSLWEHPRWILKRAAHWSTGRVVGYRPGCPIRGVFPCYRCPRHSVEPIRRCGGLPSSVRRLSSDGIHAWNFGTDG